MRDNRRKLGVTQKDLALTSGAGLRFVIEFEKGKPTCEIGKVLTVVETPGHPHHLHAAGRRKKAPWW